MTPSHDGIHRQKQLAIQISRDRQTARTIAIEDKS